MNKKKGVSLLNLIIVISVVSLLAMGMYIFLSSNSKSVVADVESKQMYYYAKSGIEVGEAVLSSKISQTLDGSPEDVTVKSIFFAEIKGSDPYINGKKITDDSDYKNLTINGLIYLLGKNTSNDENDLIKSLPNCVTITINMTKVKKDRKVIENGVEKTVKKDFVSIESRAVNSNWDKAYVLTKFVDENNINSFYE